MKKDAENGQEYLTTDVRRVVAHYYFYASYFFVFYFLRCLAQFSPASLSCTRQSNLFPCKITTHGHRPGCSTVCNYVKTMLIEIAWKNPFIMPVEKEKGKQSGWMVRAVTLSMRMEDRQKEFYQQKQDIIIIKKL